MKRTRMHDVLASETLSDLKRIKMWQEAQLAKEEKRDSKPTQVRAFLIDDLRKQGLSCKKIADRFGISVSAVRTILLRNEINRQKFGDEVVDESREIVELLQLGCREYIALMQAGIYNIERLQAFLVNWASGEVRNVARLTPVVHKSLSRKLLELGVIDDIIQLPPPRGEHLTPEDWKECLEYWHHRCAGCGSDGDGEVLQQDHWVPRAFTGTFITSVTNIIPLCAECNNDKSAEDGYSWLVRKFGKRDADRKMRAILDYFEWWRERGRE